jgi:hypothetical protein
MSVRRSSAWSRRTRRPKRSPQSPRVDVLQYGNRAVGDLMGIARYLTDATMSTRTRVGEPRLIEKPWMLQSDSSRSK